MTKRDETLTDEQAKFWSRKDEWELHEAALLFIGIDPHTERGSRLKKTLRNEYGGGFESLSDDEKDQMAEVHEIIKLAYIADRNHKLTVYTCWKGSVSYGSVEARAFLIWARDKFERDPPTALMPIIADVKSRAELEQEVKRLQTELQQRPRWPWGNHNTHLLDVLADGGEEFWRAYVTGSDPATAPTNVEVRDWLVGRYKIAKRVADVMAQILRADNLPKGPRPRTSKKTSRPSKA